MHNRKDLTLQPESMTTLASQALNVKTLPLKRRRHTCTLKSERCVRTLPAHREIRGRDNDDDSLKHLAGLTALYVTISQLLAHKITH